MQGTCCSSVCVHVLPCGLCLWLMLLSFELVIAISHSTNGDVVD